MLTKLSDVSRFSTRLLILSILLTVPFLRMLLQEDYGFLYPEVAVPAAALIGVAALLAATARTRLAFDGLLLVLSVLLSVNAVHSDFLPHARWRVPLTICTVLFLSAILVFRKNFYPIFTVFILGSFAVDLGGWIAANRQPEPTAQAAAAGKLNHVVHIILDEMIGLAAVPPECRECVKASAMFRSILERGNFRIYPHAFSNYRKTRDSIASILNGRLVNRSVEFFGGDEDHRLVLLGERSRGAARPFVHENRYFDAYLAKQYSIRAYQSDYILYSSPEYPTVRARTYRANSLREMHSIPFPWTTRMRQLLVIYLQSDRFWWENWRRLSPENLHPDKLNIGPVVLGDTWPGRILKDIRAAGRNTLFFAHLLTPHYPYVFEPDGRLRDWHDWNSHTDLEFDDGEAADYERRYSTYARQVQFVARQVDAFIRELRASGLYDSTTLIIHGDHGSRLRLLSRQYQAWRDAISKPASAAGPAGWNEGLPEADRRDLLNQFATLLAIKLPGAASPRVIERPGSVLYFLREVFGFPDSKESPDRLNSVYLFARDGAPRQISMINAFEGTPEVRMSHLPEGAN